MSPTLAAFLFSLNVIQVPQIPTPLDRSSKSTASFHPVTAQRHRHLHHYEAVPHLASQFKSSFNSLLSLLQAALNQHLAPSLSEPVSLDVLAQWRQIEDVQYTYDVMDSTENGCYMALIPFLRDILIWLRRSCPEMFPSRSREFRLKISKSPPTLNVRTDLVLYMGETMILAFELKSPAVLAHHIPVLEERASEPGGRYVCLLRSQSPGDTNSDCILAKLGVAVTEPNDGENGNAGPGSNCCGLGVILDGFKWVLCQYQYDDGRRGHGVLRCGISPLQDIFGVDSEENISLFQLVVFVAIRARFKESLAVELPRLTYSPLSNSAPAPTSRRLRRSQRFSIGHRFGNEMETNDNDDISRTDTQRQHALAVKQMKQIASRNNDALVKSPFLNVVYTFEDMDILYDPTEILRRLTATEIHQLSSSSPSYLSYSSSPSEHDNLSPKQSASGVVEIIPIARLPRNLSVEHVNLRPVGFEGPLYGAIGEVYRAQWGDELYILKYCGRKHFADLAREAEYICGINDSGLPICIPTFFGMFWNEWRAVLILSDNGSPISHRQMESISLNQRERLMNTIRLLHQFGIAHGDIKENNILTSSTGLTLIDFSHTYQHDCPGETAFVMSCNTPQNIWVWLEGEYRGVDHLMCDTVSYVYALLEDMTI